MKNIKKRYKVIMGLILVIIIGGLVMTYSYRPLNRQHTIDEIQKKIEKVVSGNSELTSSIVRIYSESKGFDETFIAGKTGKNLQKEIIESQPFFTASVTKTITSTVVAALYEEGLLDFKDKITNYLNDDVIGNLFVYEGIDYKEEVTIEQLLNHTSGVADYFEGPVTRGSAMKELIIEEPDHFWTIIELIEFSKKYQSAVGKPGEQMKYSDTGYILLGIIIENITEKPFHKVLHERILTPLNMKDTYMLFRSEPINQPKKPILEIWLNGKDLSKTNAISSSSYTEGGMVSTTEDLLKFYKALNEGRIVELTTLEKMKSFNHKRMDGIYDGYGIVEFRFGEFSKLLSDMPNLTGGIGASGTFMLYDEANDTYIIANFGSAEVMEKCVETLISILMIYDRMEL